MSLNVIYMFLTFVLRDRQEIFDLLTVENQSEKNCQRIPELKRA